MTAPQPKKKEMRPSEIQQKVFHDTMEKLHRSQDLKNDVLLYLRNNHREFFKTNAQRLKRMHECSNVIAYRRRLETGDYQLVSSNFCKYDKACIACATKRAMRMIKKFATGVYEHKLTTKNRYSIVLTISHRKWESYETVMGRLMQFKQKLGKMYRNSHRASQKTKSFFSQFDGMVMSLEVTYGKNGRHPHLNILACSDTEIIIDRNRYDRNKDKVDKNGNPVPTLTNETLKAERLKITKRSFIHNIRKINVINKHFSRSGIGEVFKYAIKFSSLETKQLAELMIAQVKHKYRFFETLGIFRGRDQGIGKKYDGEWKEVTMLYNKNEKEYKIVDAEYSYEEEIKNTETKIPPVSIGEIIADMEFKELEV